MSITLKLPVAYVDDYTADCFCVEGCEVTPPPEILATTLDSIKYVKSIFSMQIYATNNPTYYSADNLPAGVAVNTTTGAITGTPTKSGSYTITVWAYNAAGGGGARYSITLTLPAGPVPVIDLTAKSTYVEGVFSYQIKATSALTITYSASGMPSGVTINTTTGLISGKPTAAGTFTITFYATNSNGSAGATLTIPIQIPKWFRVTFSQTQGYITANMQLGGVRVGNYLSVKNTKFTDLPCNWGAYLASDNYCDCNWSDGGSAGYGYYFDCCEYTQSMYSVFTYGTSSAYLRSSGNTLDLNIEQYRIDHPTASTISATISPGDWYYSISDAESLTHINATCAKTDEYSRVTFPVLRWETVNVTGACYQDWAGNGWCDPSYSYDEQFTAYLCKGPFYPALKFGTTTRTSKQVNGYSGGSVITRSCYVYDGDPNVNGSTVLWSSTDTYPKVWAWTHFSENTVTINIVGGKYSIT